MDWGSFCWGAFAMAVVGLSGGWCWFHYGKVKRRKARYEKAKWNPQQIKEARNG